MPGTRKLGRTTAQRTAMLRAMVTFLLENEILFRLLVLNEHYRTGLCQVEYDMVESDFLNGNRNPFTIYKL